MARVRRSVRQIEEFGDLFWCAGEFIFPCHLRGTLFVLVVYKKAISGCFFGSKRLILLHVFDTLFRNYEGSGLHGFSFRNQDLKQISLLLDVLHLNVR